MSVCAKCNTDDLDDAKKWPLERQLAVKMISDPHWFDLAAICKLRGRPASSITLADIVPWLTLCL
jgi:hypothetical protein